MSCSIYEFLMFAQRFPSFKAARSTFPRSLEMRALKKELPQAVADDSGWQRANLRLLSVR